MASSSFCNSSEITRETLDREMLKLVLSLYNHPLLSRNCADKILGNFNSFISDFFVPFIQNEIKNCKSIVDTPSYYKIKFILESKKNLFTKFATEHNRLKMLQEKNLYVPPQTFVIGEEPRTEIIDGKPKIVMKSIEATYVSMKDTLTMFFSRPRILRKMEEYTSEILKERTSLSNFIQGSLWQSKYHVANKKVFPIFLYFDEFETRNPLGSHAGEEKLGGVYFSIPTLPPNLAAKVKHIFVSTIFHSKYLKVFGCKNVFRKSIENLNLLSKEGIEVNVDGIKEKIYFECALILGDNLGLNTICGFSESFSANRYCRICAGTREECCTMVVENFDLIRTVTGYIADVIKNDFSTTGIKQECIFNAINKFHICENCTIDIMHDLSEGISAYVIEKILQVLLSDKSLTLNKQLTLDVINHRINTFPYSDCEKENKPRQLFYTLGKKGTNKIKIKQSAAELLCLARYLGLMIGDLISPNCELWKLYILLRKIIGILTAPSLDYAQIAAVERYIEKHNTLYIKLFGKLKPKMHLLIHYPRLLKLNGPAVHFSALKFERKNRKLKEIATGTNSNKNLPYTIAIKHQLQLCYDTEFCAVPIEHNVDLGPVHSLNAVNDLRKLLPTIPDGTEVKTCKNIEIIGKQFSAGTIFIYKITHDGPHFAKIKTIFYVCNKIFIQAEEFDTLYFNDYYHAYSVHLHPHKRDILINVEVIPRLYPCTYCIVNSEELIALRCDV